MRTKSFLYQLQNELWNERIKILILGFLFIFQVLSSIISIFYMEEILKLFGFEFINPAPPTGEAAFLDYFTDQLIFGLLIMSLGTMNIFSGDIENGSICYSLTRPISRTNYSIAKLVARLTALILPFVVASLIGWVYMAMMFEVFPIERLFWSLVILVLLYAYLGTVTSALSTRVSALTAGLGAIALFIVQFSLSAFKPIELLSPFTYAAIWSDFLLGSSIALDEIFLGFALIGWILVPFIISIFSIKTRDL
ncbi:MAG: ABC transporter permease subunit [Candidatus Heimdallarchaeota archaeon]|nr:MAG: ABC transporter permease subunit [Candidatus Heimdallarchaeota archaeon]